MLLNVGVEKFNDKGKTIEVFLNNGTSVETDAVILAIGVKPETKLAVEAGLEIGETRGILVNEFYKHQSRYLCSWRCNRSSAFHQQ